MNKQVKIVFAYFIVFHTLLFGATMVFADCTGCGDDGHQVCPIEKKHKHVTILKEEQTSSSEPETVLYLQFVYLRLMKRYKKISRSCCK